MTETLMDHTSYLSLHTVLRLLPSIIVVMKAVRWICTEQSSLGIPLTSRSIQWKERQPINKYLYE